ncbi:MAG: hypothetical protein MN733_24520 [Nitrososphaera sp.]|nr:hypothetical protein [Nitrososphaera sp.]
MTKTTKTEGGSKFTKIDPSEIKAMGLGDLVAQYVEVQTLLKAALRLGYAPETPEGKTWNFSMNNVKGDFTGMSRILADKPAPAVAATKKAEAKPPVVARVDVSKLSASLFTKDKATGKITRKR